MNDENTSLVDWLFATWKSMSAAGKLLAGGTALIWLLWLFWLPIAQNSTEQNTQQTFLPSITDSQTETADEEVYIPAVTDGISSEEGTD